MDATQLNAYRRLGLDQLERLLVALPEEAHEADIFVDSAIRKLSNLPPAPAGAQPYVGLYGAGSSLDDYRDEATDRLQDLLMKQPKLIDLDSDVDKYLRVLSSLPPRPEGTDPYERLFVLRPDDSEDEMGEESDDTAKKLSTPPKQYVTAEQLVQIAGSNKLADRIKMLTPGVNATFERYQINTPLRMAHFLAQVMHESGGFRWLKEIWGPTDVQRRYEGRRDLGNTVSGDGKLFMGRGLIQLTGRANYAAFAKAIGVDVVAKPQLLESSPYAVLAAGWFWDTKKLNALADKDDLLRLTRRVNGGTNGLNDRAKYLKRAKLVLKAK